MIQDVNMGAAPSALNHTSTTEEATAHTASITSTRDYAGKIAAKYANRTATFEVKDNVATYTGAADEQDILTAFSVAKLIPEVTIFEFTLPNDQMRVFEALTQIESDATSHLREAGRVYRSPYQVTEAVIGKTTFRRTAMKVW